MDHAAIVFTPYLVDLQLVDTVLDEIAQETHCSTHFRRHIYLTREDVEALYPELVLSPLFPMITECLTSGRAELAVVIGEGIHLKLRQLKGKFRYEGGCASATGLRKKYQKDLSSFEFILHTTDSSEETDEIGVRLFGEDYRELICSMQCYGC